LSNTTIISPPFGGGEVWRLRVCVPPGVTQGFASDAVSGAFGYGDGVAVGDADADGPPGDADEPVDGLGVPELLAPGDVVDPPGEAEEPADPGDVDGVVVLWLPACVLGPEPLPPQAVSTDVAHTSARAPSR
jgi:hypothetical protein